MPGLLLWRLGFVESLHVVTVVALAVLYITPALAQGQWGPETRLATSVRDVFGLAMNVGDIWGHGIAASGRTVHLVWGANPVRYRRSLDEGETWGTDSSLATSGEVRLADPVIAQGSDVYVVIFRPVNRAKDWCCPRALGDIYLKRSRDGGSSWDREIRLTTAGGAFRVSLAASGSRLHLVWSDFRSKKWEIYYRESLDGGSSWEPEMLLVPGAIAEVNRPQVAALGDAVHVVWHDDRDGHPKCYTLSHCIEVYYKRSRDGGKTWERDVPLTFGPPLSGRPDIAAIAPSTVIVGYDEDRDDNDGHEQYVLRSIDNGTTWTPPLRLTSSPGGSTHNSLIAAGAVAHLAWFDSRDPGNAEIYYRVSLEGGATWQAEERVTDAEGESTTPLLAATAGYLHAIWLDRRMGKGEVWYRRRSLATGPTAPPQAAHSSRKREAGADGSPAWLLVFPLLVLVILWWHWRSSR